MVMYTVATVSMQVSFDREKNLSRYLYYLDRASEIGADLLVLPEQSLQGYLQNIAELRMESLEYQYAHAEPVPAGPSTQLLVREAQQRNLYIIWGMTEVDGEDGPDVLYNTAVLVGPEGYIGKYRKVHQPLDELHIYWPGNEWPIFETRLGRLGLLICYDKQFPEAARELTLRGAQVLVMPTAWALTCVGGDPDPEQDYQSYLYDLFELTRAAENQLWFISSNQYGRCGDHDYLGRSRIIAPTGRPVAEILYEEGMVSAHIDILDGIVRGRTTQSLGYNALRDRRPETYTAITAPRVPRVKQ
ncbi:carbon-nitrogen hydrolase family protein [Tengunoibacter tsumagoiensis]|uniref:Apolipoprotein N-acyltransferase n=1 Tax=Tengunoibacter tsumagoiensis TaxID=2014871 RepID=A0A402A994_9CHLR|nr:carbon-nitrogen hydrolase family protein [Tengunoibacter tsumagoiensis]GCE15754.1 apolipoprotein N-acyltransferase [Tengunoibacter tsumagoiensis]